MPLHVPDQRFAVRLRELREQRRMSLRALQVRALSSRSRLSDYELGKSLPPLDVAIRVDTALRAGGELVTLLTAAQRTVAAREGLEFAPGWSRAVLVATGLWRGDVERRKVLRGAAFAASAFMAPAMRAMLPVDEQLTGDGPRDVDESDVEMIRRVTMTLRGLDNEFGGAAVREVVVRFLDADLAPLLRGGYSETVGRSLLSATAEATRLAGWTTYDAGLHGLSQRYLIQALRLATAARDLPLAAEIIAAMSHQCAYLRSPTEAVDLARVAARLAADSGVQAIAAEAAVLEAHGYAQAGDERACTVALDRAERTLDRADRATDPQWISYFDEAYLSAKFGHCFAALGRADLAERFASRSLDMDGRFVRGRQFNLALLATAHAGKGEVEQAATVGGEAVKLAVRLKSSRSAEYVRKLADQLAGHAGLPAVDEFTEQVGPLLARAGPSPS